MFRVKAMATKLFVGRLSDGTTGDDLLPLFRKYGSVTECTVLGNYGFVVSIFCLTTYFPYSHVIQSSSKGLLNLNLHKK
jgi:RNA recognition motif-containing protein